MCYSACPNEQFIKQHMKNEMILVTWPSTRCQETHLAKSLLYVKIFLIKHQARVVQRVDNAIHRINHYPVDSVVCFVNIYPLDSDLSGGLRYPAFEQLGPGF